MTNEFDPRRWTPGREQDVTDGLTMVHDAARDDAGDIAVQLDGVGVDLSVVDADLVQDHIGGKDAPWSREYIELVAGRVQRIGRSRSTSVSGT